MSAVVVARDEETRILLRGLLRLRHFRIVGEAEGSTHGGELVRTHHPQLLLIDANLAEGSSQALIRSAREAAPETRVVLVGSLHGDAGAAPPANPDATLPRPFRIAQFEAAVTLPPRPEAEAPRAD